eukprot:Lithocolla_globosa_v1_NODE_686_length_3437_cov_22.345062.p5 type:complete len:108 gc:universal NODE_686_length_3437_cov_22.345062:1270-947(-)
MDLGPCSSPFISEKMTSIIAGPVCTCISQETCLRNFPDVSRGFVGMPLSTIIILSSEGTCYSSVGEIPERTKIESGRGQHVVVVTITKRPSLVNGDIQLPPSYILPI